jgi:hypothetical protein
VLFCPAAPPLSSQTPDCTTGVICRHRWQIGSCWRKPNPGQQAPTGVLAHPRKGETFAGLAAGFGVGTATAWGYASETMTLLGEGAERAFAGIGSLSIGATICISFASKGQGFKSTQPRIVVLQDIGMTRAPEEAHTGVPSARTAPPGPCTPGPRLVAGQAQRCQTASRLARLP